MFFGSIVFFLLVAQSWAQGAAAPAPAPAEAAKAVASPNSPHTPELLEHLVDGLLERFDVATDENTPLRYGICLGILLVTFLLRHFVTNIIFSFFRRLAAKTETTLDDELFTALQLPVDTLVVVVGGVGAIKALKLSVAADNFLGYSYTIAFSAVVFWLLLRAFNTILDHMHEVARAKQMGVATLMPWIKKTLVAAFFIIGVLMIIKNLGFDVGALFGGLAIGGLAFSLAAQDTIANLFGSVVVAIDQPFKVGDVVRIGAHEGGVEEIGLRSTKIRTGAKTLVAIPNKSVASEAITNLTNMSLRRVEHTIGLTYDTAPDSMERVLEDIRALLKATDGVSQDFIVVNFVNLGASSLDIQIIYFVTNIDFRKHLELREKINLQIMRAVAARGLSFAFPTQTIELGGNLAKKITER